MAQVGKGDEPSKLSHKKWRALRKKLKRKQKRQKEGAARDELLQKEEDKRQQSPTYSIQVAEEERKAKCEAERLEFERQRKHALWVEREDRALLEIKAKKEWEAKEQMRREEEEQRIREEWEQQQEREKEEENRKLIEEQERKQREDEKKKKQKDLLKEATANEKPTEGEDWHNPLAPPSYQDENVERCPFFQRTGACRFGDRCSRAHVRPESSSTLLIPGMYSHYELEQSMLDEYDTDLSLEYEDSELYRSFLEFFHDVLPEFKSVGNVIQFKVCCNHEPHLRGNVYVQYTREEYAQAAFMKFNGRWYAGRQLSCEFTAVNKWQPAICGLFYKKRCPKGKNCNFLHVFKNPGNEFWEADRDYDLQRSQRSWSVRSRRPRSKSPTVRRNRSRSPRSRKRRSKSRSPRKRRRHRSGSYSSKRYKRSRRSRSRSPRQRSKFRSRSPKRRRSRTRSRSRERRIVKLDSSFGGNRSKSKSRSPDATESGQHEISSSKNFIPKKPISFTVKSRDSRKENKVIVESLVWSDFDQEIGNGDDREIERHRRKKSPNGSKSGSDVDEKSSTKKKRHKKKRKLKRQKPDKDHAENLPICSEQDDNVVIRDNVLDNSDGTAL